MSDLATVLSTWLDGQSTTGMDLYGIRMLTVGRFGKGLLFLAGLSVGLDLLDPDKVRRRGEANQERAGRTLAQGRHKRDVARLSALHKTVTEDMATVWSASTAGGTISGISVHATPPGRVPEGLDVTLEVYRSFHRTVIDELRVYAGDENEYTHARDRAAEFLSSHLSGPDRALFTEAERAGRNEGCVLVALAGVLIAMVFVFGAVRTSSAAMPWAFMVMIAATVLLLFTLSTVSRLRAAAAWRWLLGRALRRLAATLRSARPFHGFRKAAFALFFVGSILDMLAS
ncbi:hypothetical protein [Streptosporangium pseudovulgare]|uniref:DUF4239 domain-containing protein n=1 Tax=Streptosporangium pseudovulgare TaxID=35765 RepID=A0ABQ2R823_9ACTN|nr:hypothetical protein [Streptosporangium pseudovulgare]GGQ18394.1 hypothetical protein GCM10010140_56030 [Streptosporangium pseudovulgare]